MALEITEQANGRIIIRDFLDLEEASFVDVIRRMDIAVRAMMVDLKELLESKITIFDD